MTKVSPVFLVAACLICCDSVLAEEKSYTIDIPAQSLATALEKLAEQTKIKPFYNDKLVMGKTAPTIQGGFTPRDALQKLLSGSGLTFTFTSEDSVVINALDSGNNAPGTLPAVKVFGKALYDATAPDNPDYRLPNASTATKTDTPIMETPFNVQVVPRQVLEDRQSVRLDKALENISSVIPATGVGAAYGQQSGTLIRGFVTQDYYLDGVRIPTGRLTDGYREMANIQQVEVLKGPASILYGRMEPGGIVNLITKQALDTPFTQVSQQFGSYDFYRTTLDTTGPLSQNKDVLYRVNLAYENSGSFRDYLHNERVFFAPKLQWNISERSKLNMHLEYQRSANATDYGFLASQTTTKPLAFPISQNLAGPNTQLDSERINFGYDWSHAFNDNWKLNQRFETVFLPMSNLQPQFIPIGTRQYYAFLGDLQNDNTPFPCTLQSCQYYTIQYKQNQSAENYYTTLNLQGKFDTWGIQHNLLIGGDYTRINMRNTFAYSQETPILDAAYPDYSQLIANLANPNRLSRNGQDEGWGGFYVQDQLELPHHLHVLAGFRYDDATNTTWNEDLYFSDPARTLQPYTTVSNHDTAVKPRFGVLWQPLSALSVYGNYVENFGLSQGHNADNTPLPSVTAQQFEGGVKTELFEGRFSGSLAWFEITKQNLAIADTSPLGLQTGAYRAIGEVRNRGVELDLAGEILPGWRMIGNYSYIDTRVIRDSDFNGGPGNVGNRLPNVPRNSASFWNTYEFQEAALRGLKFGAGVVLRDQRQGDLNNDIQLPGYATLDLMAGYGVKLGKTKISAQINAYNILDKRYYESSPGSQSLPAIGYGIMPGAPTTVMGMLRLEF